MIPEFGTNTGRQGVFDPQDPEQYKAALARLRTLMSQYGEDKLSGHFTGDTGLTPNSLSGYADWQNAMTEAQNIGRIAQGNKPMDIEFGGDTSSPAMHGLRAGMTQSFLPRAANPSTVGRIATPDMPEHPEHKRWMLEDPSRQGRYGR